MKKVNNSIVVSILIVSMIFIMTGCAAEQKEKQLANTSKMDTKYWTDANKTYRDDPNVSHLIFVQDNGNCQASVKVFEKSIEKRTGSDDVSVWTEVLTCDANVGKDGVGAANIDDSITPAGDFEITEAFGLKENPGTKLPYTNVTDDTYCCGDELPQFNQIIDLKEYPHKCTGEHMIEYSPSYNYGFFFDYNKEQERGKGFAFFFHAMDQKDFTYGCIAVSEENMIKILKMVQPGDRLLIK